MAKITSISDLKKLQEDLHNQLKLRENSQSPEGLVQIKVAMATCGIASGAKEVMDYLIDELDKRSIDAVVTQTGCMGYCYAEPTIEVTLPGKEAVTFGWVDTHKADSIIEKYIKGHELVEGIIPNNFISVD